MGTSGERLTRISATRADTWLGCPRRYWSKYLSGERSSRDWAHLGYANAIHAALRDRYGDPESAAMTPTELVARAWSPRGFRDAAHSDHWRAIATGLVERYVDEGPGRAVHSTERSLGARIDGAVVDARVDRIDFAPESESESESESDGEEGREALVIVDYKTGRGVPTTDDVRGSLALALYVTTVRQSLRRPCSQVELHHVPSGARVEWRHDDAAIARHMGRASDIAAEIRQATDSWEGSAQDAQAIAGLFPARPSALCGFCDALPKCAEGRGIATPKRSWDGLPEEPSD